MKMSAMSPALELRVYQTKIRDIDELGQCPCNVYDNVHH